MKFAPFTAEQLLEAFHGNSMSSKHVLLIYSMIIGLNAKTIVDLGLGNSTRVARAAAAKTGGVVYSCDMDEARYKEYEKLDLPDWKFFCMMSTQMIDLVPEPFDFVFHDASHLHDVVRDDLLLIIPKMRQYGLICVHDTQQPRYTLLEAVDEAVQIAGVSQPVSMLTLPYGCGLTLLRVEESAHPPIDPAGRLRGDRVVTVPKSISEVRRKEKKR